MSKAYDDAMKLLNNVIDASCECCETNNCSKDKEFTNNLNQAIVETQPTLLEQINESQGVGAVISPTEMENIVVAVENKGEDKSKDEDEGKDKDRDEQNIVPFNIKIATEQQLFFFHEYSPGSCFWLPNGTKIYNKLMEFIRNEYFKRDFFEVKTPVIAKKDLWEISGHWDQYKENMFCFDCDNQEYATKAMNCPLHALLFKNTVRSYRELPLRLADFGPLHRNELRGALTSLFRVRQFTQDDAHIFCTREQSKTEIVSALEFITFIYGKFGFTLEMGLSTRPDKFIGKIEQWDCAELELKSALNESGMEWQVKEKDGAFYGPKIDVHLKDSLGRKHQCGTIQLDFQLPERFDLKFQTDNKTLDRPVMIHRAIFGSFERFIAILCEHYDRKWPFWLNPRQIKIVPIKCTQELLEYSKKVQEQLKEFKYYVDIDNRDDHIKNKIKDAQNEQYSYILVVGQKELDTNSVNVRYRDSENKKMISMTDLIIELNQNVLQFK